MADQEAFHVDPDLDEKYYRLTLENAGGFVVVVNGQSHPVPHVATASVRQIAEEVMVSLAARHRTIPDDYPLEAGDPGVTQFSVDERTGRLVPQQVEVRNMCMCDSGLAYPECHAKGGRNVGRIIPPRWAHDKPSGGGPDPE